jgi:hypothetical protein
MSFILGCYGHESPAYGEARLGKPLRFPAEKRAGRNMEKTGLFRLARCWGNLFRRETNNGYGLFGW